MSKSFLVYDIETSGFNPAFDQIVQFAAIRTGEDFQEQERHNLLIRLRPDVVPSAGALCTHRIPIQDTLIDGLPEYEALLGIHQLFNRPHTTSIGYNSLKFDDQFLRFSFHRNLLPPYTHQWANGCGRMDLYPIIIMYWLYRPESARWPQVDGQDRLKLALLSEANQLAQGQAHDALVDVEATVALARQLRQADPAFWETCAAYFDKAQDGKRPEQLEGMAGLEQYPIGLLVHPRFGRAGAYRAPVLYLGQSRPYKNQSLWLRLDEPALTKLTVDAVADSFVVRKKVGELGFVLPPASDVLDDERRQTVVENVRWLRANGDVLEALAEYHRHYRYPEVAGVDADAAVYQGFMGDVEQVRCQRFHEASLREKVPLCSHFDGHTRTLAERVLARNYGLGYHFPAYGLYLCRVQGPEPPLDYRGNLRRTPADVLAEIGELRQGGKLDEEEERLLVDLEAYVCYTFRNPSRESIRRGSD